MIYKNNVENLLKKAVQTRLQMRSMVIDILVQLGAIGKENAVTFDSETGQAPSFFSINCAYNDGTDVYVQKLWIEKGAGVIADYVIPSAQCEDERYESNMSLADESCVDYEDMLTWLKEKLD
jgi:hypothetical protein